MSSKVEGEPPDSKGAPPKTEMPKLDMTLALWLGLFIFGGGLLALYYAEINYFPEVTWQGALNYMALMAMIGGSLLVAYSFLLFVPGVIWSEYLISDRQLFQVLKIGGPDRDWEPCVLSITKRILFPFAMFMAFCHCLLYLLNQTRMPVWFLAVGATVSLGSVSVLLARDLLEKLPCAAESEERASSADVIEDTTALWWHRLHVAISHTALFLLFIDKVRSSSSAASLRVNTQFLWAAALLPLVSLLLLLVDLLVDRRERAPAHSSSLPSGSAQVASRTDEVADRPSPPPIPDKWSLICRAILAFSSAALLSLAALCFFYRIYSSGEDFAMSEAKVEVVPLELLVLCTLVVILANLIVSVLHRKHPHMALLAGCLGALVLLVAGHLLPSKEARLPARIMEKFGFGVPNVTLVLTERGGRILCQHGVPVKFEKWARSQGGMAGSSQTENFCVRDEKPKDSEKKTEQAPVPEEKPKGTEKKTEQASAPEETPKVSGKKAEEPREEILARAEGMKILSRLGSEFLLSFGNKDDERTIALQKGEVVSWSAPRPRPQGRQ